MYYYQAYGLDIASEFYLPELIGGGNGKDLTITKGNLDLPKLKETVIKRQNLKSWFGGTFNEAYMYWQDLGKFLAKNGTELIVEPTSDRIPFEFLNLYILSEALGMILFQKGLFLLHASAIKVGNKAIVIVGSPGAGKSTTAAAFAKRGHPVLTDDMVAIEVESEQTPQVIPGFPQIKIWLPSVEGLNYDTNTLPVLFPGSTKRVIRKTENFPSQSIPLSEIYFLDKGEQLTINPMEEVEALLSFACYFPCPYDLLKAKAQKNHFLQSSHLLDRIPVFKIQRHDSFEVLHQWIEAIEQKHNKHNSFLI